VKTMRKNTRCATLCSGEDRQIRARGRRQTSKARDRKDRPHSSSSSEDSNDQYDPQSDEDIVGADTQYETNLADEERTSTARHPDSVFVDDDKQISSAGEDSMSQRRRPAADTTAQFATSISTSPLLAT
jgi:hypothetical protein